MSKSKKWHYAWIILIAVALIRGFSAGGINSAGGLFLKPVSDEIGVGIGQLSLYLSVSSFIMMIWLPIGGKIVNKYSAKRIGIIGAILQAGSFIAFGFMDSVWAWYILAIPNAMGATLLVNILGPVLINRWFAKSKGLAIGIMMSVVGLLGAILQPITTNLIANSGWRNTYMTIGILVLVVVVIVSLLLLKSHPKGQAYGMDEKSKKIQNGQSNNIGVSASIAKKSSPFYLLILFMVALTGFAVFTQHITTYGLELGYSIQTVGMALSLSMIGAAIGSLIIGILSDKIGVVPTSVIMIGIGIVAVVLFLIGANSLIVFALATFLHGLASSAIGVLAPLLTGTFFGSKDYEKLYSNIMVGSPLASIVLLPAYGFIYDMFGGYTIVFILLLVMMVIALISLLIGWKKSENLLSEHGNNITKKVI